MIHKKLKPHLIFLQLMVVGAHSLDGLPAARNVVVEHKSELVLVPTPNQLTVARTVWEMLRRQENATRIHAQVNSISNLILE